MDEYTVKRFDQELSELNSLVLQMGGLVREQISHAMEAMRNEDLEASREVIARDHVVNLLALRPPKGRDLCMVMSLAKTVSDLERIGDEAERIARMTIQM